MKIFSVFVHINKYILDEINTIDYNINLTQNIINQLKNTTVKSIIKSPSK